MHWLPLQRAIGINPEYADAFYGLGTIRYIQSEYESALVAYKKVLEINPRHAKAHNGLDKIYALATSYCQQAESCYQQGGLCVGTRCIRTSN